MPVFKVWNKGRIGSPLMGHPNLSTKVSSLGPGIRAPKEIGRNSLRS